MRNKKVLSLLLLLLDLLVIFTSQLVGVKGSDEKKFYIVYLGDRSVDEDSAVRKHIDVLSSVKERFAIFPFTAF
ncbi:hypothetical protein TIFTF001_039115 [Ficus carica]|uniref:Uncharacterized protein n=1 Tax=Ficus carica TaxID=3494 RepID=A0AA88JFJ7_FICCA|nr:hypothetical protein TIFTF001_039115 [Ficus carica]